MQRHYKSILTVSVFICLALVVWALGSRQRALDEPSADSLSPQIPKSLQVTHDPLVLRKAIAQGYEKLRFYGRVLDFNDKPVKGASVKVFLRLIKTIGRTPSEHVLTTDKDGRFLIDHVYGDRFNIINIECFGYKVPLGGTSSQETHSFVSYGPEKNYDPDPANPIVFRLWKNRGDDNPLLFSSVSFKVSQPGGEFEIDLLKEILVKDHSAEGDLTLTIQPFDDSEGLAAKPKVLLTTGEGTGLKPIATQGPHPWEAPTEGYVGRVDFPNDLVGTHNSFLAYIRGRNGAFYGYVSLVVRPDPKGLFVQVGALLNTTGSRNIESETIERDIKTLQARLALQQAPAPPPSPVGKPLLVPPEAGSQPKPKPLRKPWRGDGAGLYGRVTDQEDAAVPGVTVVAAGREDGTSTIKEFMTTTDEEGRFSFKTLAYGSVLFRQVGSDGYLLPSTFIPSLTLGSPHLDWLGTRTDKPLVIRLWKRQATAKALVSGESTPEIMPDDRKTPAPLIEGAGEGEDLTVHARIKRDPEDKFIVAHEWSVALSVEGGELMEAVDPFLFLAPEGGYKPELRWVVSPDDPAFSSEITRRVYVKWGSPEPRYGRIEFIAMPIHFSALNEQGFIRLQYVLNPTGDRTLEPGIGRVYQSFSEYKKFSAAED